MSSQNGFESRGDGFVKLQVQLENLRRRFTEKATIRVGWDERTNYPDGTPVFKVARAQEYGATINHPGGTRYITDAIVTRRKKLIMTTQFVGPDFVGEAMTTKAHTIVIPPRPFLRPAIAENADSWLAKIRDDIEKTDYPLDVILERLGARMVGDIQKAIKAVQQPPLAKSTIQKRLKKGFSDLSTATKPLIDTGLMLRTVRAEVTS